MVKKRSRTKRSSKKILIICAVFLALLALGIGRYMYEQSVINEMRSIADELQPGSLLANGQDSAMPPTLICIADQPCPSFTRIWEVKHPLDQQSIVELLQLSRIPVALDTKCFLPENVSGWVSLCSVSYSKLHYNVTINFTARTYDRTKDQVQVIIKYI